ncbi:gliding motility lipoprotein GldD [Siphonobacter sp. BAB-5385]|uniref:gliding motility lipoprotein GldD n=1 Tax=unclassified Siphonobacter TaxID=2635712 RepID=UPI000B9E1331|nr:MULTISPECIES: gliding motility lipoprotein GldD [unclassified Siphonobacter]OZI08933.1 gliding motility lipoprotein GldD [Siphonobacter sp. BAB-5385]PMD96623.1 gliding motility lipoprotein GldD [Siphonobacter sp. BAB-5405]
MLRTLSYSFLTFLMSSILWSCSEDYTPKPKGFPRIDLPPHAYQPLTENHPYTFEYSKAAVIKPDTFKGAEPHWIFITYPSLKANVQLTYKPVQGSKERLRGFISDAYKLAAKHQEKAYALKDAVALGKSGQTFTLLEIAGDVPSHMQFYTTDSTKHFLRGAMYLQTATENDSLAPVVEYIKQDVMHLVNTLKWKK